MYVHVDVQAVTEEGGSSVLPLWKFSTPAYKKHSVTCVAFIPGSADLIVVGFGSYDYLKQVCCARCVCVCVCVCANV